MAWTWKLGRVFGIDLYVHATFVLLLGWIAVSHLVRGHGVRTAIDGVALVLSVFCVVVMHELGHALTARRFGIGTRDITLLPIGGVASLERMPEKPAQELLVALAGPAVNVVLAALLAGIIAMTGGRYDLGESDLVGGPFLTQLLWINVSLAFFNLLPAFPMDGGRVLRAALALRMDHPRATVIAARIGQAMALLFGVLGLLGNPMLILIAVFVWVGAKSESSMVTTRAALRGVPVHAAMITDFRSLSPRDPLSHAVELVIAGFQQEFPVVTPDGVIGILTRADLVRGLAERGAEATVEGAMSRSVATIDPDDPLEEAIARLQGGPPIVVVKHGGAVGLLTMENVGELILMDQALHRNHV